MTDLSAVQAAAEAAVQQPAQPHPVRSPRGATLSCKSWLTEAAFRMLQNNIDHEVAENPDEMVV